MRSVSSPTLRRVRSLGPLLLFAAATAVFHFREILGARPYLRDTHMLFVPAKAFFAQQWAEGRWAEWWPYSGLGAPLLAQPLFGFFHPSTLLYGLLPFWKAFVFQDMLATFSVFVGFYALARQWKLPPAYPAFAAIAYGLCGYVSGLSEFPFSKWAAGAWPLYVAAVLYSVPRSRRAAILPALALALLILSGDVQQALWGVALAAVFAWVRWPKLRARALYVSVFSLVFGVALSTMQWLPALKVAPYTERGRALLEANQWALHARHLLGHLWPLEHGPYDFVPSTYLGLAVVALALASAVFLRHRRVQLLWGLALLSCLLALGEAGGLTTVFRKVVPFWNQFRYPIKSLIVFEACLSLLAAQVAWWAQRRRFRRRVAASVVAVMAVFGTLGLWQMGESAVLPLLWSWALLAVIGVAWASRRMRPGVFVACCLLAASLLANQAAGRVTTESPLYEEPSLATALKAQGVGLSGPAFDRVDDTQRRVSEWAWACAQGAGGGNCSLNALWGLPCLSPNQPGSSLRVRDLIAKNRNEVAFRLAGIFGVGYLVLPTPLEEALVSQKVAEEPVTGYAAVRLPRFLPRAYSVQKARFVPDAKAAVDAVWSRTFRPGREVVLEGVGRVNDSLPMAPAREAQVTREDFDSVRVEATLEGPGYVVLNEAWFPGWTATVDGVATDIGVANAAVRAVPAPSGRHVVEMKYETPGLRLGLWVSASALGLLWVYAMATRRDSRGSRRMTR